MRAKIFFISTFVFVASFSAYAQPLLRQPIDPNATCQKAWQDYKKADTLWKTGWGLFGAGAGMTIAGCVHGPKLNIVGKAVIGQIPDFQSCVSEAALSWRLFHVSPSGRFVGKRQ